MHEIIHGSPREGKNYTHYEMARAAYILGDKMGLVTKMEGYGLKDVTPEPKRGFSGNSV
jgi:hypothetical protein